MYVHVEEATTTTTTITTRNSYDRVRKRARCTCAHNARHYGTLFGVGAHTTLLHKDAENAGKRLHTGTQMFGVALGCSSLLPPLECTWGKIVIIIKFRLVRSILRVDGSRGYFRVSVARNRDHCRVQTASSCVSQRRGPTGRPLNRAVIVASVITL